jgi:hypothetical protein
MADIVTLDGEPFIPKEMENEPALHRPGEILRRIASSLEDGVYGEVNAVVVILEGQSVEVFGGGKSCMVSYAVALTEIGKLKLIKDML